MGQCRSTTRLTVATADLAFFNEARIGIRVADSPTLERG